MSEQFYPQTATAIPSVAQPKPAIWPLDIALGALIGDFAEVLGVPGYLTQGLLGFVPVVGTCCAIRDLLANLVKGNRGGMILNAISLIPIVGGISKMAHAVRGIKNASQAYGATTNVVGALLRK